MSQLAAKSLQIAEELQQVGTRLSSEPLGLLSRLEGAARVRALASQLTAAANADGYYDAEQLDPTRRAIA